MEHANFIPDYRNIVSAARRERPKRLPLYEHNVHPRVAEAIAGKPFADLAEGDGADKREYFKRYCAVLVSLGYDVVPFEGCVTELVQGGEALCGRAAPLFSNKKEIEAWDWEGFEDKYFARFGPYFAALRDALPPGMKAVAGVGNGIFETVQDFVPLVDLSYLEADDEEAFGLLWTRVADLMVRLWKRFDVEYGDAYCLYRMGDDLGFKSSLLLRPDTIRKHIIPAYARVVAVAKAAGKPFLLHSCGCIFDVMDEIISVARIDAKHSNEDAIAPFSRWLETYSDRIGLFGGVDMDLLCRESPAGIRDYVGEILNLASAYPGFALGSGNQIADYVPPEGFLAMVETVRRFRGE
ncbi:hypothetical protein MASR2M78_33380 [Treponema sp.]